MPNWQKNTEDIGSFATEVAKNTDIEIVEFSKIGSIKVEKFTFYKHKYSSGNSGYKEVYMRGLRFKSNFQLNENELEAFYLDNEKEPNRKINATKVAHMQKRLEYIPRVHCVLYKNLEAITVDNHNYDGE